MNAELAASDLSFVKRLAKQSGGLPVDYVLETIRVRQNGIRDGRLVALNLTSYTPKSLDVSSLDALETLAVHGANLSELVLGKPARLTKLDVRDSKKLTTLDLSTCTALRELDFSRTGVTKLPAALPKRLVALACSDNSLGTVVLRSKTIESLEVSRAGLSALDVSGLPSLTRLDCSQNRIHELDLRSLEKLSVLWCQHNGAKVTLPPRAPLVKLSMGGNSVATFDARAYPELATLFVGDTGLHTLTLANPHLSHFDCSKNALTLLDLGKVPALAILEADENQLTALDVRRLAKLRELTVDDSVHVECTELQKHVLPALRARARLPAPTNTIAKMDLYQLHAAAGTHNWDDGPKRLFDIVRQTKCTLPTALLIYWNSEPAELSAYKTPKDAPRDEKKWVELLREIEAGVAKKRYPPGPLSFDARDVNGVDLSNADPKIPSVMRKPVRGK